MTWIAWPSEEIWLAWIPCGKAARRLTTKLPTASKLNPSWLSLEVALVGCDPLTKFSKEETRLSSPASAVETADIKPSELANELDNACVPETITSSVGLWMFSATNTPVFTLLALTCEAWMLCALKTPANVALPRRSKIAAGKTSVPETAAFPMMKWPSPCNATDSEPTSGLSVAISASCAATELLVSVPAKTLADTTCDEPALEASSFKVAWIDAIAADAPASDGSPSAAVLPPHDPFFTNIMTMPVPVPSNPLNAWPITIPDSVAFMANPGSAEAVNSSPGSIGPLLVVTLTGTRPAKARISGVPPALGTSDKRRPGLVEITPRTFGS